MKSLFIDFDEKFEHITVKKDGSLQGLVDLLYARRIIFQEWNYTRVSPGRPHHSYYRLIHGLVPWVVSEPSFQLPIESPSIGSIPKIVCDNPKYKSVFTGSKRASSRTIIDLIPFGYDVDKLEIRLLELWDVVDVFVIYESGVTLVGGPKPLFFDILRKTSRFQKFQSKIIYFSATAQDLVKKIPPLGSRRNKYWPLSETMRQRPLQLLIKLEKLLEAYGDIVNVTSEQQPPSQPGHVNLKFFVQAKLPIFLEGTDIQQLSRLRHIVMDARYTGGLFLQNDADEIPLRETIAHLRHCEANKISGPIVIPATMYRTNTHWLAQLGDWNQCKNKPPLNVSTGLHDAVWITGPRAWPAGQVFRHRETMRLRQRTNCANHMGIGAAIHLSSIAEPGEVLLKEASVIEGSVKDISRDFIEKAASGNLMATDVYKELVVPRCGGKLHISRLSPDEQNFIEKHLPKALLLYPDRYPFLVPHKSQSVYSGLIAATADEVWMKGVTCNQQVWK
jgi:hypothetical protein